MHFSLAFLAATFCTVTFSCESKFSHMLDQEYYTAYWLRYSTLDRTAFEKKYYPASFKSRTSIEKLPQHVQDQITVLSEKAQRCNDCLHLHYVLAKLTSDANFSNIVHSQRVRALDCANK